MGSNPVGTQRVSTRRPRVRHYMDRQANKTFCGIKFTKGLSWASLTNNTLPLCKKCGWVEKMKLEYTYRTSYSYETKSERNAVSMKMHMHTCGNCTKDFMCTKKECDTYCSTLCWYFGPFE